MTNQEALERLKASVFITTRMSGKTNFELHGIVIKALEKQVPKNPIGWNSDCWNCGEMLSGYENQPSYCPSCGQAIDWS